MGLLHYETNFLQQVAHEDIKKKTIFIKEAYSFGFDINNLC
jgi:hypothetical protein